MSKKRLFLYITSSIVIALTLLIIGLAANVALGGLNVNYIKQRLSSYLMTEHEINLKSDEDRTITSTCQPWLTNFLTKLDPTNPVAPVTRARFFITLL